MQSGTRWTLGTLLGSAALTAAGGLGLSFYSDRIAREAERLVPQDGRHVQVDGARLHYVDRGSGPAIVMIHGLAGQLRNFSYAMLEPLARDHRVLLVDRPGSGYSTADDDGEPNIVEQAAIIARFIETLGLDRPLLVGHSLGGAVALALALDRPDLVRGLALIAPLSQPQDDVPEAFKGLAAIPPTMRRLMARTLGTPMSRLTAERTLQAVFAPETPPADFATRGGGALAQRPDAIAAAAADLAAAHADMGALAARYATLAVPTAILFGRDDAILSASLHGETTAAMIPAARITIIPGGHMIPVTAPEATIRFVADASARCA
ncbi:pimeloyl-ACP methyl ester carboxylesterase [Sphingomonas insulae]|uniref:Alpha/beta fold hydrolase n=1 Tax=Sphingomonas insulae TaxID=424800 RepID=A0ABP3T4U4_9SPHN|nr:alpha/beta hydrolase [Sphingomonas insulae]NIJ31189.1 pimeloyl-ACP methyl ester carboxylesterase [Sphingomonas insulae]